jgi:hypothetical protein
MDDGGAAASRHLSRSAGSGRAPGPDRSRPSGESTRADEADATAARDRYRAEGVVPVTPDARIQHLLGPGEVLVAVHGALVADSRAAADGSGVPPGISGELYLTSERLVFTGGVFVAYPLGDVLEAVVAGEDVLLVMGDGVGLRVTVAEPRLLRVQIAAARAARRGQVRGGPPAAEGRRTRARQAPSR